MVRLYRFQFLRPSVVSLIVDTIEDSRLPLDMQSREDSDPAKVNRGNPGIRELHGPDFEEDEECSGDVGVRSKDDSQDRDRCRKE